MSNILEITYKGDKYKLLLGMVCTQIVSEKSVAVAERKQKISDIKYLSFVIYGGLCNWAEKCDEAYPDYELAYDITNQICEDDLEIKDPVKKLQNIIYTTWSETKPSKELLSLLPQGDKKKVEKKKIGNV